MKTDNSTRLFIYFSVLIHILGAVILYHYYSGKSVPEVVKQRQEPSALSQSQPVPNTKPAKQFKKNKSEIKKSPSKSLSKKPVSFKKKLTQNKPVTPQPLPSSQIKETQEPAVIKAPSPVEPDVPLTKTSPDKKIIPVQKDQKIQDKIEKPKELDVNIKNTKPAQDVKPTAQAKIKFVNYLNMKKQGLHDLEYPLEARRQNQQGEVVIIYFVDDQGLVEKIQLKKSSGHSLLDNHVLRKVARWRFVNEQPVWVEHKVKFALEGNTIEHLPLRLK